MFIVALMSRFVCKNGVLKKTVNNAVFGKVVLGLGL